jgi:hypothetical protein
MKCSIHARRVKVRQSDGTGNQISVLRASGNTQCSQDDDGQCSNKLHQIHCASLSAKKDSCSILMPLALHISCNSRVHCDLASSGCPNVPRLHPGVITQMVYSVVPSDHGTRAAYWRIESSLKPRIMSILDAERSKTHACVKLLVWVVRECAMTPRNDGPGLTTTLAGQLPPAPERSAESIRPAIEYRSCQTQS